MPTQSSSLVGLGPGQLAGRRFGLVDGQLVLGRDHGCDLYLDDRYISRRHATVVVDRGRAWVEDLGSGAGTLVNEQRISGRYELRPGDVLGLGGVRMRYEAAAPSGPVLNFRDQYGRTINNVAGNQNYYQQRDSLLRDIAATKTRGRRLIGFGFAVLLIGFGTFAAAVLRFMADIADGVSGRSTGPPTTPFGIEIFGIPSGLIGWALAVVGSVLIIIGIVMHVSATARRRRVDRDLPPGWTPG